MTITEKIAMYREKNTFIENLNKAFQTYPKGSTVASVKYEVYRKDTKDTTYFVEYIVVTFFGGAISVHTVNGNSNNANFRTIGSMIDGGYYDEVRDYEELKNIGYEKVNLNSRRFVLPNEAKEVFGEKNNPSYAEIMQYAYNSQKEIIIKNQRLMIRMIS